MSQTEFQLLQEQIKGLGTLMNAQFLGVNERLDKINGTVQKHDDAITGALVERSANRQKQEDYFMEIDDMEKRVTEMEKIEVNHILNCPVSPKLRILEDNMLSQKSIKKWILLSISTTGVVMAIIWILVQIYFKAHGA